ncbi:unnamed protein product [Durusdinium trenchii]|uniref:Uncharacterized protein n=2 Tax=Durusdinium trenchii TaxID=1381693 RepID=A0ABP0S255_9DINO
MSPSHKDDGRSGSRASTSGSTDLEAPPLNGDIETSSSSYVSDKTKSSSEVENTEDDLTTSEGSEEALTSLPKRRALRPLEAEPVGWSGVRRRAILRSVLAATLAITAIIWPLVAFAVNGKAPCEHEEYKVSAYVVISYSTVMSLLCLRMVLNSEMTWWLLSPFLVQQRWHIFLDATNVWLLHIATNPLCSLRASYADTHVFRTLSLVCQIFFWLNKFMGYSIITTHLVMLERAFDRPLGTRFLDFLKIPFGLGLLSGSILLCFFHFFGERHWAILCVAAIELSVVFSTLFVMVLMTRGFLLALRAAQMYRNHGTSSVAQKEMVEKALRFSKRMVFETPLNLTVVAAGFFTHCLWLFYDHPPEENVLGDYETIFENIYVMTAMTSLTNCARFGSLLSLVEMGTSTKTKLLRAAQSMRSSASQTFGPEWRTGHEEWDAKTLDLSKRAISLSALLDFYGSLQERMPHFDPAKHTTEDVVRQAIIPMSRGTVHGDCAACMVLMGEPLMPDRMVTHSWSNLFACLVAAVVADALGLPCYECVLRDDRLSPKELGALRAELYWKNKLETKYWICCFAVNQHAGICNSMPRMDPVTHRSPMPCACDHPKYWSDTEPLRDGQSVNCEMNKFDDMMSCIASFNPRFSQLIAVDRDFKLFTRAWCVAEIHRAQSMRLAQRMSIFSEGNLREHEEWLHLLKVEQMKASNPSDTELILAKIDDKQRFNEELQSLIFDENGLVQACHAGFDKVSLLGAIAQRGATRGMSSA